MVRYLGAIILVSLLLFAANYLKAPQSVEESKVSEATINGIYEVMSVTDGDTLLIETESGPQPLRIIGIDAPETKYSEKGEECMAEEATLYLKELLNNKQVNVIADPTQDTYDDYNRLLAYVETEEVDIGLKMIEKGLAEEFTFIKPYGRQEIYKAAEENAKEQGIGIWSCD